MHPESGPTDRTRRDQVQARQRTDLITLLFTDVVDSTALKQQLGDRGSAAVFQQHHQLIRDTLAAFPGGEEIETAGDSFLIRFDTPSEAIQFALRVQVGLRALASSVGGHLADRVGIHLGEVLLGVSSKKEASRDVYGIQIDTCARVLSLAKGGQILMTRAVFDSARQVLKGEGIEGVGSLEWLNHGPYVLKGLTEPVEICEVREVGQDTGGPPSNSDKAQRQALAGEEQVLGWRPAIDQFVPKTRWQLQQKLGEGGFGEVWLGRNSTTKEQRVFKFCFVGERVRFLKRELTLFRLLKERVGDHPNIVRLHDVCLQEPPFYIEMDYVEGKDLRTWCEELGGATKLPLEVRLEVVAQAADALQAAHNAGVIHRDVKPANILIDSRGSNVERGQPQAPSDLAQRHWTDKSDQLTVLAKLTDFGIGQVVSEEALQGITRAGFTQTILSSSSTSHTGTQLYMAPELLSGKPASPRSDIYSLGVVLFQLLVDDFSRPVTTDWWKEISDPLLREDLNLCFAGNPEDRFESARELAKNLRTLPLRRQAITQREAELAARERSAYRLGMIRTASVAGVIVAALAVLVVLAVRQTRLARAREEEKRQLLYVAGINLAHRALQEGNIQSAEALLDSHLPKRGEKGDWRGFEWTALKRLCQGDQQFAFPEQRYPVHCVAFSSDGKLLATGSRDAEGENGRIDMGEPTQGELKIYDLQTRNEVLSLANASAGVAAVAFSSRRLLAAGYTDGTITLWDPQARRSAGLLSGHTSAVGVLSFSPDGEWLASGDLDGIVRLWNMQTKLEQGQTNIGFQLWTINFSPDGRRIALGGMSGGSVTILDARTLSREEIPFGRGWISGVTFAPDGKALGVVCYDGVVRIINSDTSDRNRGLERASRSCLGAGHFSGWSDNRIGRCG